MPAALAAVPAKLPPPALPLPSLSMPKPPNADTMTRAQLTAIGRVSWLARAPAAQLDAALAALQQECPVDRALEFSLFWVSLFCE